MTCDQSRELFAQALYHELDATTQEALNDHLGGCKACTQEFEAMRKALSVMDRRTRHEPTQQEWNTYWQQLNQKIQQEGNYVFPLRIIRRRPASIPAWAYGIAAMLLIAGGIYAGRTFFSGQPVLNVQPPEERTAQATPPPASAHDSTSQEALAYLERSRNLLIGLTNIDETQQAAIDLRSHQRISRQLIDEGNILTVALNKPDHQLIRQLIEDLQIILLQLANTEIRPGVPVVELVKKGIDEKSILLKINLEAMRASELQSSGENSEKKQSKGL